ncbi:MAG: transporter substrate-binding domain-containing protein, partial [Candidatus Paceibacterota bacterium]
MNTKIYNFLQKAFVVLALSVPILGFAAPEDILSKEEIFWLEKRNNTIVVYPEKGYPPFSYQSTSGVPQGLSMEYLELIAEKIGAKISYLPARPLSQITEDIKQGKGDIVTSITPTPTKEEFLYFTDEYITVPAVIVVRKDFNKEHLNISDLNGKKVAVGDGYAVGEFLKKNYPRIILDRVTDDEVGLQQLVLGEVDMAVMDIASFSFYISKQVLNSVKVVGNVGFDYKLSFAVPKDKQPLQVILDKGLSQISTNERANLNAKWIAVPEEHKADKDLSVLIEDYFHSFAMYVSFGVLLGVIVILIMRQSKSR